MANWKEKGVVPDSDDEEEFDSQSTIDHEKRDNAADDEFYDIDDVLERINDSRHEEERACSNSRDIVEEMRMSQASSVDLIQSFDVVNVVSVGSPKEQAVRDSLDMVKQDQKQPIEDGVITSLGEPAAAAEADDISTSWIRALSPASSILSSPPPSPIRSSPVVQLLSSPVQRPKLSTHPDWIREETPEQLHPAFDHSNSVPKRQFRERKPVQIHPFLLEQQRYEQRMKASHIKPVRIGLSQEEKNRRRRVAHGQEVWDKDFQDPEEAEEAETGVMEESQPMTSNAGYPSQSTSADTVRETIINPEDSTLREDEDDSDQEFPDLPELFKQDSNLVKTKQKKSSKKYSTKNRLRLTSEAQHANKGPTFDIYDFSGSSPTAFPSIRSGNAQETISRVASTPSSAISTPVWQDQSSPHFRRSMEVQTPITSAIKASSYASPTKIILDEDDPFADPIVIPSSPSASSSLSSSEEEDEMVLLKKRMKHVLPASHLRLDQKRKEIRGHKSRARRNLKPNEKRAGVALPLVRGTKPNTSTQTVDRLAFLESDESDEPDENNFAGFPMDTDGRTEAPSLFQESDLAFAIEDDRIDGMLPTPSRKRRAKNSFNQPNSKRLMTSSYSGGRQQLHSYQPRITSHLTSTATTVRKSTKPKQKRRKRLPPKLSIIDVAQDSGYFELNAPAFLKVAARSARSRKELGRQSPTGKFIRLATREDTADAQAVLQDWRNRKIQPRNVSYVSRSGNASNSYPLSQISVNQQTKLPPPITKLKTSLHKAQPNAVYINTRNIRLPRVKQLSMNEFVENRHDGPEEPPSKNVGTVNTKSKPRTRTDPYFTGPTARSAQLEAKQFPINTLEPRKKTLDALFRMGRCQPLQRGNLQLSRFLADDDVVYPSIESYLSNENNDLMPTSAAQKVNNQNRRRKRVPQHVDAGAAIYRQPSEPLILDFSTPSLGEVGIDHGKLFGLGKFGTRYPHHFDVFPLQTGIYFHETTFIGSGRLANMLSHSDLISFDDNRPATSLQLGDRVFVWETWNEIVSEQMGVCVDWLTEQLTDKSKISDKPDLVATTNLILDYVQHSITFSSSKLRGDFLLRMLEILEDFSSRLNVCRGSIYYVYNRQTTEVTTRLMVLSLRLLRMSRIAAHVSALRLEEVLQKLAGSCISLLISEGLETVRKMYDDLQYLSVRENGIRNDRYLAESWVIIIHVLGAAKIPRASFWDVVNIQLGAKSIGSSQDVNEMEKLWFFMFSLLPLFEFDEHGHIPSASRQELGFDNWSLAQQLIKRVFALYATNTRQSASFNNYCRAIVSRCHYLMSKWGWWRCSGIVGALFDCFALQKLANLRNEEVHKSPQFLEDLNTESPLDVEPEDRCFHIFLKIVAIAIRHQRAVGNTKGIRNLVARILPNHDRQFPKEEAIFHRDLASLRNHHDLLCTVYWAAPSGYGPPITSLQKLVSAARSHNEAFLINLRAWERLARFTLSSIPSSFPVDSYKPFITWQDSFFNSLLGEYVELTQVRRQLQIQSDGAFQTDVDCNRRSTMSCIQAVARSMMETLKCSNRTTLKHAINLDMIVKMFSTGSSNDKIDQELTSSAIEILTCYLHQLHDAEPETKLEASPDEDDEFDSQGLESDPDWAKEMQFMDDYINPLDRAITSIFQDSVRKILHDGPFPLGVTTNYFFLERLTRCWAQLISVFMRFGLYSPNVFLAAGVNAVFKHREQSHCTLVAWPLFLSELLEHTESLQSDFPGFDIGSEWMIAISKPQHELRWENALTCQLLKKGHFLLAGEIMEGSCLESFRQGATSVTKNQQLIKNGIIRMQRIFSDKALLASTFGNVSSETVRTKFSGILNSTMLSMQHHLQNFQNTNNVAHEAYVSFVQEIVSQIRSHCSDICPPPEFFFRRSFAYWPPETDPTLYLAGLISYTLQLSSQQEKARNGLIYYLWNGLRSSLSGTHALHSYIKRISKGARHIHLLKFLLTDIVPSTLEVAFGKEAGSLACEVYLVAVSKAFESLVLSGQSVEELVVHMKVLLQHMFNNLGIHYGRFGHSIEAVHPSHQGIITVIFRFWRACRPHLYNLNTGPGSGVGEIFQCFDGFVEAAIVCFENDQDINFQFKHFDIGKVGNDVAMEEMAREVQSNWRINKADGGVDVRTNDGTIVNHCFTNGPRDLREVLEGIFSSESFDVRKTGASLDCYF
ncbi:af5c9729-9225-4499-a152-9b0b34697a8b [Sclerotinia trifoliorum]|uniref:Af5c9729-9225-4499-a152-9b0b34697a8b n=1 Tax=Sclerotinia trifoliorum TaxID=28548 RepID=A0A8H2VTB8_9HELO|nr:af5c9729-9225-4499-a152-9b0b34697a8b [Sclerotinia trifoliorum]